MNNRLVFGYDDRLMPAGDITRAEAAAIDQPSLRQHALNDGIQGR